MQQNRKWNFTVTPHKIADDVFHRQTIVHPKSTYQFPAKLSMPPSDNVFTGSYFKPNSAEAEGGVPWVS